ADLLARMTGVPPPSHRRSVRSCCLRPRRPWMFTLLRAGQSCRHPKTEPSSFQWRRDRGVGWGWSPWARRMSVYLVAFTRDAENSEIWQDKDRSMKRTLISHAAHRAAYSGAPGSCLAPANEAIVAGGV